MSPSEAKAVAQAVDQQLADFKRQIRDELSLELRAEIRSQVLSEVRAELATQAKTAAPTKTAGTLRDIALATTDLATASKSTSARLAALEKGRGGISVAGQKALAESIEGWVRRSIQPWMARVKRLEDAAGVAHD